MFLDTKVMSDRNRLVIDLYTKPKVINQYLHQQSCHCSHCKMSIAFSQALRMHWICSSTHDYERRVGILKTYVVNSCYEGEKVQHEINQASNFERKDLLAP